MKSFWETARDALGFRRYLIGGVLTVVLFVFVWFSEFAAKQGYPSFLSLPHWIVGAFTILGFFALCMWRYAAELRTQLAPKIALSFDQNCLMVTPIISVQNQTTQRSTATCVRVRATSLTRRLVKDCAAFLTGIEREIGPGAYAPNVVRESVQLIWAGYSHSVVSIPFGIPAHAGVLIAEGNQLSVADTFPLYLENAFMHPGRYRLTVNVVAEGITTTISIIVAWGGQWNNLQAIAA